MSKGYRAGARSKPEQFEFVDPAPAGSLSATGADMARFMIAHLQDGEYGDAPILQAGDRAADARRRADDHCRACNRMVLGFYETDINGHRVIAHGGDTQWFHCDLHLFLDDGVGLFISMNSPGKDGAARLIREALFERVRRSLLPGPGPTGEASTRRPRRARPA